MNTRISLTEAASFLGVSKQTLRNWDKAGKLVPERNPRNGYRVYRLNELQALQQNSLNDLTTNEISSMRPTETNGLTGHNDDLFEIRRKVGRLNNIIRDTASYSSIIERFDEISKLLFLRALVERGELPTDFFSDLLECPTAHVARIRNAYEDICSEYADLIPETFRTIKLPDETLAQASKFIETLPVSSTRIDVKGLAFEEVIQNTFEKGDNQQFFTPGAVTQFLVEMIRDHAGARLCDPACGTGGFLVEVLKHDLPVEHVTGIEIDPRLSWTTRLNLLMHGCESFSVHTIEGSGTLGPSAIKFSGKFDTIITNPPFGSDVTNQETLSQFELGKGFSARRRGILFIEKCLSMLAPNGRLAIVIDDGVLSLPSTADVRDFILENYVIEAIVSLPETAFMPYANVNTSILIIKNERPTGGELTFYAKVNNVGRKPNGDPDYLYNESGESSLNNELPDILELWRDFLNTGRVDPAAPQAFTTNLTNRTTDIDNRIDYQYHHPSRYDAIQVLGKSKNPIHSLFELCTERKETIVPRKQAETTTLPFTGLAHIESFTGRGIQVETPSASLKSAVKKYYNGDILFARMRPNLRKCLLVDFSKPGFTSAECIVLKPRRDRHGQPIIDPVLLAVLLRSDLVYGQIIHKVAGIGRPRISLEDLRQIKIPVPKWEEQHSLVAAYHEKVNDAYALRREAKILEAKAETTLGDAISSLTSAI